MLRAEDAYFADGDETKRLPDRLILTSLFARRRGGIEADVLILADGTPWTLELPFTIRNPVQGKARPVLLVDLADSQVQTAREATRARLHDYCDRGWVIEKGLPRSCQAWFYNAK